MAEHKVPLENITGPAKVPLDSIVGAPPEGMTPPGDPPYQNLRSGKDAGVGGSFVSGFTTNDDETIRMLASKLYPDEDLEQAVSRFGMREGQIYHKADDGQLYKALPDGWGARDLFAWMASGAGPSIPIVSGAVMGAVTMPAAATGVGLVASMGATTAAGAGGEVVRQKLGDYMMGPEVSTGELGMAQVAYEGVAALGGQAVGGGLIRRGTNRAVRDVAKLDPAKTRQAYDEAAGKGIDLTPAETTGLPTLAAQQKRLGNITATSDEMGEFYAKRDLQVHEAFEKGLGDMSKFADAEDVGRLARAAAQDHLEDLRLENLAKAKPYYEKAFSEGDREIWSEGLERLTGTNAVQRAMRKAAAEWQDTQIADGFGAMNPGAMIDHGIITFKGGKIPAYPNLQFWDYTKRMLDDEIRVAQKAGQRSKAGTLTRITAKLRDELDQAAPGAYAEARSIYGTGAENVQTALQSVLGILADTKDTALLSATRNIFNPTTRSPQMVAKVRKAIESKDPQAWQALKRLYLDDVAEKAMNAVETGGDVLNPAGKLYKAFSKPKLRANLEAAMSKEEWRQFNSLMVVYKRAGSIKRVGSDTAFNQMEEREAMKAAESMPAKLAKIGINPNKALRAWGEWRTEQNMDRLAKQTIELVTSGDPAVINLMKELRRLSPADKNWRLIFGHLISQGTFGVGKQLVSGADREPNEQPH